MSTAQPPATGWFRTAQKAIALIEMQRPDAAIAALTPLLADPQANASEVQFLIAYSHMQAHRLDLAVRHAHASIGLEPENVSAHEVLAQAELRLGHASEAADAAAQAVRLDPEDVRGHLLSALALTDLERPEEAQAAARQAVALAPHDADSHVVLGWTLRLTNVDDAARAYEQALALDPHSIVAQAGLANLSPRRITMSSTPPTMVRLMADHPSVRWPALLFELGVLSVLRSTWVAVLPFWIATTLLLGEHPVIAVVVALTAGPSLVGLTWYRLGPWRRAMPAGLRQILSRMWRTLPIMPGLVVCTAASWAATVVMAWVGLVGSSAGAHRAFVASIVVGVVGFVALHVLQRLTLPTIRARTAAPF